MRHKIFLLGLLLVLVSTNCTKAQQGEFIPETEVFKTFLAKFPVEYTPIYYAIDVPIDILGTNKMTYLGGNVYERSLDSVEINQFVKGKLPIDMNSVCYLGCLAAARVKTKLLQNDKFVMLEIVKDNETGCGEEDFLVVYNRKGEIIIVRITRTEFIAKRSHRTRDIIRFTNHTIFRDLITVNRITSSQLF